MNADEMLRMDAVITEAGLLSARLDGDDLEKLWNAKYRTAERLRRATRSGLERANLAPGVVDDILIALGTAAGPSLRTAGAAAGPSSASTAAGGAPAPTRLVDSAAKLRPVADKGAWELCYSDESLVYIDSVGVVDHIRSWARKARKAAVRDIQAIAPKPLLISGLVKTGKSFTQQHVVPAVVAAELCRGQEVGSWANMVVLRLKADELSREEGATVMLRSLLRVLLTWAREEQVPVRESAVQAAEAVLASPFNTNEPDTAGFAISGFFNAVEVPMLVLCDEVQSLFLPTKGGKLDTSGAAYVRNSFMKHLLLYGRRTTLWCLTGSSMSQTWISLASMPPNGYAMVIRAFPVHLPTANSQEDMQLAWELLESRLGPLNRELREACPPSVALMTILVLEWGWASSEHPIDVAAFVGDFMWTKLVEESRKEWHLAVEDMPLAERLTLMDLADPGVGAQFDMALHPGLKRFLMPHLEKTADGCSYYLRDPHQRQILRLMFNNDGTMRTSWSDLEFSASLTQLDGGWVLLRLGETADYLLGPHAKRRSLPAGSKLFNEKTQDIAMDIGSKLELAEGGKLSPRELWEKQPWFQRVLKSEWNVADCGNKRDRDARTSHLDMLVFYLRLSRNVLAHMKPWNLAHNVMVDVSVIEALPSVLGLSVFEFTAVLVQALSELSRTTVMEARDKYQKQPSGSGGGATTGSKRPSRSTKGRGRGGSTEAVAGMCALAFPGPAVGRGQRTPLVHATGSQRVWGQGELRAAMLTPRLRVQQSLFAPSAAAGLRLLR